VQLFDRPALKKHKDSIWILSVVKDVEMEESALKEAFAKTERPLGWYCAGRFSKYASREQFEWYKKSAEGGCSWGQAVVALYYNGGYGFIAQDEDLRREWLEKAAKQNNPWALAELGRDFEHDQDNRDQYLAYLTAAGELGWQSAKRALGFYWTKIDFRRSVIWHARGEWHGFGYCLEDAQLALEKGMTEELACDFDQLCYTLGWGIYWHYFRTKHWSIEAETVKAFGNRCLDYYCSCVEWQQKSIFAFLLCWNQTVGVKDVGVMIAKTVWEGREDDLVKPFMRSE
jgi:TPR repeat protein